MNRCPHCGARAGFFGFLKMKGKPPVYACPSCHRDSVVEPSGYGSINGITSIIFTVIFIPTTCLPEPKLVIAGLCLAELLAASIGLNYLLFLLMCHLRPGEAGGEAPTEALTGHPGR